MYFYLSKTLDFFISPLNVIGLLSIFAFIFWKLERHKFARVLAGCVIVLWIGVGYTPLPTLLLTKLENIVPRPVNLNLEEYDCILVLGGGVGSGLIPLLRDEASLGSAAERLTKALEFAKNSRNLKILFSGFSGEMFHHGVSESSVAERFFLEQGIPKSSLIFESYSRNTYENAILTKKVMEKYGLSRPLLVTSALHMPRASKTFLRAFEGRPIIFYPVDYRTSGQINWLQYSWTLGIGQWEAALREIIGIFIYSLTKKL